MKFSFTFIVGLPFVIWPVIHAAIAYSNGMTNEEQSQAGSAQFKSKWLPRAIVSIDPDSPLGIAYLKIVPGAAVDDLGCCR